MPGNSSFQVFLHDHGVPRCRKHELLGQPSEGRNLSQLMSSKTLKMRGQLVKMVCLPTLPETNSSHLKIDGWKTTFLLGRPIFRCYENFREPLFLCASLLGSTKKNSVVFQEKSFCPSSSEHDDMFMLSHGLRVSYLL